MTKLVTIFPGVELAEGVVVDDFVVLGRPPRDRDPGDLTLAIGAGSVIRSHTVIYAGTRIGARLQTGHHVLIREKTAIGDDCSIGTGSVVEHSVTIGNRVRLHSQVFVPELSVLEDDAWLGPSVAVTNARFPLSSTTKDMLEGVVIRAQAKVGANATLLPGIEIGVNALVGAGSVVTRDVEAGAVVAGNPARVVGRVEDLRYPGSHLIPYPSSRSTSR
ncbi:MAG TPA: acyltransferase [Thermoanaerobaculia bacterium]|nr:acyltransferase [Thermoanaerobaculia bacterium]